jgi:hypothetical protein
MSTNPDQVVQTLSWFLAGRAELEQVEQVLVDPDDLGPESARLIRELRQELSKPDVAPPKLEPLVRETIEAIAHGD